MRNLCIDLIVIVGYEMSTLYAEAETKTFHANESDPSVTYMYLEEVKIFLKDSNNTKKYFKLNATSTAIHVTRNKDEASLFTLATTPELHRTGEFQIVFSPSPSSEDVTATAENLIYNALVMEQDTTKENLSQHGPYRLVSHSVNNPFEIHGVSTTLPEFGS